ncbi:C13 family peptidase [Geoglobus ahangari]
MRGIVLLITSAILLVSLAGVGNAEYDPPGPPAVEVRVWLLSFTPLDNFDDGWNGKSDIRFEATGNAKDGRGYYTYFEYDHDTISGKIVPKSKEGKEVMQILYKVRECWPVDLEIEIKATDVDNPPVDPDDYLGSAKFTVDKTLKKRFYSVVIPGKFVVNVYVEAVPVKEDSDKCSYFFDQPETKSSSIVTKSGANIYDFELANMLKMWIAEKGFANMLIFFQQCFGGGMTDDILKRIDGDVAVVSAAKHDEVAYGYNESSVGVKVDPFSREVIEGLKSGKSAKEIARDVEKKDEYGVYANKRYNGYVDERSEHTQYKAKGEGDKVRLGKNADGSEVKSKHAIVFAGDPDDTYDWTEVKGFVDMLKGQGFSDEDIVVLAGSGRSAARPYVDGPGTKQALWNAIKDLSGKMNKDEQFVIFVTDHGNLEKTEKALDLLINDPVKQPVPVKNEELENEDVWILDEDFLEVLNTTDDNVPYISLMILPPTEIIEEDLTYEFLGNVTLHLNEFELEPEIIEPVYALDELPDLDAYEVVFPIYDEGILGRENVIELSFDQPEMFRPFTVEMLLISTGSIPRVIDAEKPVVEEPPRPELVLELTPVFDVANETLILSDSPILSEDEISELIASGDLFALMVEKKDWYNNNTHLVPGFVKDWLGNTRVNVEILMDDGSVMDIYMVVENAYINEFEKGKLNDATARASLSEETVRRIISSDDPVAEVQKAYSNGEIQYSGVGFVESVKVEVVKVIVKIYFIISDLLG